MVDAREQLRQRVVQPLIHQRGLLGGRASADGQLLQVALEHGRRHRRQSERRAHRIKGLRGAWADLMTRALPTMRSGEVALATAQIDAAGVA